MTLDVRTLFTSRTAAQWLTWGLDLATSLGLTVTSWEVDSPTRVAFKYLANALAQRDSVAAELIKAGWIRSATGTWKTLVAQDVFGVTRGEATYATPTVTLTNAKGGVYARDADEVIVKASSTGVTFRSTEALALASGPGTSATITLIADVAGSAGTVGVNDIDEIVTTMLGVSVTSSTAAAGVDEQSDASLETECLATLGALSPNGPPDAYNAVCLNAELTGTTLITRASTSEDSTDGTVTVWIAGAAGALTAPTIALAQTAVELWATPATITPTVVSATENEQAVDISFTAQGVPSTYAADIEALIVAYFAEVPIGGVVSTSALIALVHEYLTDAGATDVIVALNAPAGGALAEGEVVVAGTVTITDATGGA